MPAGSKSNLHVATWRAMPPIVRPLDHRSGATERSRPWLASASGSSLRSISRTAVETAAGDPRSRCRRGCRPPVRRRSRELLRRSRVGRADHRDVAARRSGRAAGVRRALPAAVAPPGPGRAAARDDRGARARPAHARRRDRRRGPPRDRDLRRRPEDARTPDGRVPCRSCAAWPTARRSRSRASSSRSRTR